METERRKDFYHVIVPLLYISKLVGVTPFNLEGSVGRRRLIISYLHLVYSVILQVILIINATLYVYILDSGYDHVLTILAMSMNLFNCVLSVIVPGAFLYHSTSLLELLNRCADFDVKLSNLLDIRDDLYGKSRLFITIQTCCGICLYLLPGNFLFIVVFCDDFANYFRQFLSLISHFERVVSDMHIGNMIMYFTQRFSKINLIIQRHIDECESLEGHGGCRMREDRRFVSYVKCTQSLYADLCKLAQRMNSIYNVPVLIEALTKFSVMLLYTYFYSLSLLGGKKADFAVNMWHILFLSTLMWHVVDLLILTNAATSASQEVSPEF